MSLNKLQFILLTGEPGVGKTTLTKKLCSALTERGVAVEGFYTEERRGAGGREGFDVVTVRGERGELAREASRVQGPVRYRVGKNAVMLEEFERVAMPALNMPPNATTPSILLIDEIGKMELFSSRFRACVSEVLSSARVVLATVPLRAGDALVEGARRHPASKLFQITKENRNTIQQDIMKDLQRALQL